MLLKFLETLEEAIHASWCELQLEGQAPLQPCLESFEPFFNSEPSDSPWTIVAGIVILVTYIGWRLWIHGSVTLRHLALFGKSGIQLISIIAIVTISSWLYVLNSWAQFSDLETLGIVFLVSTPFIVIYVSNIFNANYRVLAETSAERRLKINILLFAQLAIILIGAALVSTTLELGLVGMFLVIISTEIRAQIHKRCNL